jgi:pSer/pThr/pTyr-binding forkhead associated (FHA) protein
MLELQVPLLAAKALILLLLFAFIYAVMSRSIGDLRKIPDDEPYVPGQSRDRNEDSEILAPETRFEIGDGETSVGRSSGSNIVLKSDDYASGRHAQLTRHGGLLYVEDLGSTNGTFVNGRKTVGATPLRHGDTVRVGSTTFRYEE